jgi:FkbM family methyltransferase
MADASCASECYLVQALFSRSKIYVLSSSTARLIYDVGAHKGEDTDFYLRKGFRVVAVEANPQLADILRSRFQSELAQGRLVIEETAISDREGEVDFFVNETMSTWGTMMPAWVERNEKMGKPMHSIRVCAKRFDQLVARHGAPYYVKVDIEGADLICVQALADVPTLPQFVSIESSKTSWNALQHEFDVLVKLGYRKFKIVNQKAVGRQRAPVPALEGESVPHRFAVGSTGLFGAELPGQWLSRTQALNVYRPIMFRHRWFGDNTKGRRLLRKFPLSLLRPVLVPNWHDTHASL